MKTLSQLFLTTLVLSLFSCKKEKKEIKKFIRPVKYKEVTYLGNEKIRTFSGTAQTDKIIGLSFRSGGIITQLDTKLGQRVKKGQLLAKLDNVQARLSYENAVSSMNSAKSQMNTAKLSLDRTRALFEKGSAALSSFESVKNAYKAAKEGYESSKRGVAIQQEQIRYGYLYAPENGIISAVYAEIDENVAPGQRIATLNAGSDMEIALGLPESIINNVKKGDIVAVSFSSLQGKSFKGKVTEVSPAVNAQTATYPVVVLITNPSDEIKSGMAANVTFNLGDQKTNGKTLVVPANAVGEDNKGQFVFLINEKGNIAKVTKQQIIVGKLTTLGFEVTSGLSAGQKIATAGLQTLLDGQEVKLQ